MPPIERPLKNDGPACRVCGCTEHNACLTTVYVPSRKGSKTMKPTQCACSWVKVEGASPSLCSACSGTDGDLQEVITRCRRMLRQSGAQANDFVEKSLTAALKRAKGKKGVDAGIGFLY